MTQRARPRVFIVGGGFAGLAAAKALAGAPVEVTLIDRRNHHVFQPLLYQVATASLSPADISAPIRAVLRGQTNCQVVLAEITGVDLAQRRLLHRRRPRRVRLPGPRRRRDARLLRPRRLGPDRAGPQEPRGRHRAAAAHPSRLRVRRVRGQRGGPARGPDVRDRRRRARPASSWPGRSRRSPARRFPRDYRHIDTRTTRVILFEGGARLLPPFPPALSARAQRDLERMGVEVRLNSTVTGVTAAGLCTSARSSSRCATSSGPPA